MSKLKSRKGFTLIELLIVIAIIAIIAAVVYVALDPATRFKNARTATRWTDVSAILSAIKVDQIDNGGSYLSAIDSADNATWLMIVDGGASADVTDPCTTATSTSNHVDLVGLVSEGYLASVPISPHGNESDWIAGETGYLLYKDGQIITIQACDTEAANISVSR